MIIVKTTDGDKFVNDKAITALSHEREYKRVRFFDKDGNKIAFDNVEGVIYTNDVQPTQWTDEGSEVQRLKNELGQICEHFGFIREWFHLYQNALYDIKDAVARSKDGSDKYAVIKSMIKETDKKYKESVERFDKAMEKYKKEK